MGKAKDKLEWFGEKGKAGADTVKMATSAVGAMIGVAMVGVAAGVVNKAFGGK
jgi:hypothetical protein